MTIMKKLLICAFLLGLSLLSAQSLKVDNLGTYQRIILYLDGGFINFPNGGPVSENAISVTIDDREQNIAYRDYQEFSVTKNGFNKQEAFIHTFYTSLSQDKYLLYFTVFNDELGSRYKNSISFEVGEVTDFAPPIIVNNDTHQIIDDISKLATMENLSFNIAFSKIPQSLNLICDNELTQSIKPDTLISFTPKPDCLMKLRQTSRFSWITDGIEHQSKIGNEQIYVLYSGRYSWKHKLEQLRYVTTQRQWKQLRKLKKDEDIEAGINKFWDAYSESNNGSETMRSIFYKRIIEADRRFSFRNYKRGWMTDRGRILIKYGEPDEIVHEPLPLETRPYIIWYYYTLSKNFLFQDLKGFGDYELKNTQDED